MRKITNRFRFCHLKSAEIRSFALLLVAWTFIASVKSTSGGNIRTMQKNNHIDDEIPKGRSANRYMPKPPEDTMLLDSKFVYDDTKRRSYDAAEEECQQMGGTLATLASRKKHQAVIGLLPIEVWVGGRRDNKDAEFKWVTGEYMSPSFLPLNTKSDGGDCVSYVPDGSTGYLTNSQSCHIEMGFLCELPLNRRMHEVQYFSTVNIVRKAHITYSVALEECRSSGGRLFGPTTKREIEALKKGVEGLGMGMYWLGARKNWGEKGTTWESGDPMTRDLGTWYPGYDGNCVIYDNRVDRFGWISCWDIQDKYIQGYICQYDSP